MCRSQQVQRLVPWLSGDNANSRCRGNACLVERWLVLFGMARYTGDDKDKRSDEMSDIDRTRAQILMQARGSMLLYCSSRRRSVTR